MCAFIKTDYKKEELEGFLETFPTPLHNKLPESRYHLYVFWSQDDDDHHHEIQQGFQIHNNNNNDSFSADVDTRTRWRRMISYKIKQALCANVDRYYAPSIIQFWVPVMTSSGRRLLSTSGQPFAFSHPSKRLSKYRRRCMEYQYSIDDQHNHDDDHDPMAMVISSDAPTVSTAFLNRLPHLVFLFEDLKGATSPLVDFALECDLNYSCMLPLCFPSQTTSSSCIGVLEISTTFSISYSQTVIPMIRALKEAGLGVFESKERIPYQIIPGLKPARDEIEHALPIVCESNNIDLAQVWISFQGDNHMPFSSFSEATQKNQMLSLKLTGYLRDTGSKVYEWYFYNDYYRLCDMFPLEMGENFVGKTLEDFKPRSCNDVSKLRPYTWVNELFFNGGSRLAICLNSIHTGDFCYAFEFIWRRTNSDSDVKFVEELLSKLKELLPRFKLASGAELGDELDFLRVDDSTSTETKFMKIFQGKRLSPTHRVLEEGRTPVSVVVDYIEPLEAKSKKAPILLSREVIEQQFVDTEEIEAAEKLKGVELVEEFNVEISSPISYLNQSVKEIQIDDSVNVAYNPKDLMGGIPKVFLPYVRKIIDVAKDGNCGFRALAICLKVEEEIYEYIRQEMRKEFFNRYELYSRICVSDVELLKQSLRFSGSPCPKEYWMSMPDAGVLIANKFRVIVHFLSKSSSMTIFPFCEGPEENHKAVTIALVENHYVVVDLQGEYPMPPVLPCWNSPDINPFAAAWETKYRLPLERYTQLCHPKSCFVNLGDGTDVPHVENSTPSEKKATKSLEVPISTLKRKCKGPSAAKNKVKGSTTQRESHEEDIGAIQEPSAINRNIEPSARKYKTAPILLSQEAIEHQYKNTMKIAAKNLNVSISTLKRKCKVFGIREWQGPSPTKRKVNDPNNHSAKNEEYDGAVQDPSAINKNENTLIVKAEYADDMIKFHLCISEATFIIVEEEIGKKFKLTHGTYKLKYLDEDKDWILLASDDDLSDCIKSSINLGRIVLRLRVLPSTQQICS